MKYFSTFSGIGGFEIGIENAIQDILNSKELQYETENPISSERGLDNNSKKQRLGNFECIGYSEINKYAIQIYQKHFNHKNYGDITKINVSELPEFELLVGGFPCQAFSIAGKRKGFNDTRGTLFFDIARILKEKQPRNFILENVKGLLSHDNGRTFKTIISTLVELGYCVEWQVLNAKNFGVPQNRERVFIVGHFGGIPERKVFPIGTTNQQTIKQLNNPKHSNDRVYGKDGLSPTLNTMQGGNRQPFIANTLDANYYKGNSATKERHTPRTQIVYQDIRGVKKSQGGSGVRNSNISYTLDTWGTGGVGEGTRIRRLTPLECERLMGYPDNWTEYGITTIQENINGIIMPLKQSIKISDTQRYKTLGNGIVSNVVAEVVKKLYS